MVDPNDPERGLGRRSGDEVGRCTLHSVDPQLESAWFQVISCQVISWFQSLPFKFNLHRYNEGMEGVGPGGVNGEGGAGINGTHGTHGTGGAGAGGGGGEGEGGGGGGDWIREIDTKVFAPKPQKYFEVGGCTSC
jgi:hypothetical protein